MNKIFVNVSRWYKMHDYYEFAYNELYKNNSIITYAFFERKTTDFSKIVELKENDFLKIFFYDSFNDLLNQIKNIDNIFYINTFDEVIVPTVHDLRLNLWLNVSTHYESFRKKDKQRDILLKSYPETTVKYKSIDLDQDIEDYAYYLDFPYIIKPSSWVQSSWVSKINNIDDLKKYIANAKDLETNMTNRWIVNNNYLIEEFIDWEMYTIVYFVNNDWEIFYSPVVKVNWAEKIWIDDFFNYVRLNWKIIDSELPIDMVKEFVDKQVKAFWIKNTYIFQDFKLNSKWVLKNIELNARIWGYRLEMMQNLYGFNLLEMPLWKTLEPNSDFSNAVFVFYALSKWIFDWYDNELLSMIQKLKSFSSLRLSKQNIGNMYWSTKDWFWSLAAVRLKNNDLDIFKSDYLFLEKNYKNLIKIKN